MQLDSHETDLYILPESQDEREKVIAFLKRKAWTHHNSYSNVEGQAWHGKTFIEVPFGVTLKDELFKSIITQEAK